MPVVNDLPSMLYVRDISEREAEAFAEIKSQFGLTSNAEVVRKLFGEYLKLKQLYDDEKEKSYKLRQLNEEFRRDSEVLAESFKILKKYEKQNK